MLRTTGPLTLIRGGRVVLSGVELSLQAGEIAVLRAPNGGGKTTLLRCLAGLLKPASGGFETEEESVFAGHLDSVKSAQTVRESIAFWENIYGAPTSPQLIASLGLDDLLDIPNTFLSAGQKRRLGLSRALAAPAKIKLFDEPTNALDQTHRQLFWDGIALAANEGCGVILSSHDTEILKQARIIDLSNYAGSVSTDAIDPFLEGSFS